MEFNSVCHINYLSTVSDAFLACRLIFAINTPVWLYVFTLWLSSPSKWRLGAWRCAPFVVVAAAANAQIPGIYMYASVLWLTASLAYSAVHREFYACRISVGVAADRKCESCHSLHFLWKAIYRFIFVCSDFWHRLKKRSMPSASMVQLSVISRRRRIRLDLSSRNRRR